MQILFLKIDSVKLLMNDFTDEKIGGVCGRLILVNSRENENTAVQEKKYWDYETFIKKSEGKCGISNRFKRGNICD